MAPPSISKIRRFGLWLILFSLFLGRKSPGAAGFGVLLGLASALLPDSFGRGLFTGWLRAVAPLGAVASWSAAVLIYFGVAFPIGLILRATGRDHLRLRRPAEGSCWRPFREAQDKAGLEKLY